MTISHILFGANGNKALARKYTVILKRFPNVTKWLYVDFALERM